MCGIFGVLAGNNAKITKYDLQAILKQLYQLSESRGKESAGIHAYLPEHRQAWTLKGDVPATTLIKTAQYKSVIESVISKVFQADKIETTTPLVLLAHSRLVTNGAAEQYENNQPVRFGGVTMIHNGIIVNVDSLWSCQQHLKRNSEVDTEIIAALIDDALNKGMDVAQATGVAYREIQGTASIAWTFDLSRQVVLATNTGDLYMLHDIAQQVAIFASERYILEQVVAENMPGTNHNVIAWLAPGQGVVFDLPNLQADRFDLRVQSMRHIPIEAKYTIPAQQHDSATVSGATPGIFLPNADESLLRYNEQTMRSIRRCTCCVLPETFPFIEFDEKGICNYCHNYKPKYKGIDPITAKRSFIESIHRYRSNNSSPDVLVAFSGGRDSCYGLHLIKSEFGLNPITFTYDWGMVTDLARRNIARVCGQLGVQNILVSADIKAKRENIRKNVIAWLKQPDLGMIPLFMAGDKHFFKIVNQIKRQTGVRLDLWSANPLENTDFKSGFCGVAPDFNKKRLDYLSFSRKAKLVTYYGLHFIMNPGYLNSSLLDTIGAFVAYYIEPRCDFYFIFNYLIWDENVVNQTLIGTYDFELAPDSPSTWRIGDGTAPFYNYIYMTACGFTEFDTFRSNQIREGMISREQALERILVENRPRASSLRWYLNMINLEFNKTIKIINSLDRLGLHYH